MSEQSRTLCVNSARHFHRFSKREISGPLDLFCWLKEQETSIKVYWQDRDGTEIAAVGSVLTLRTPPCFEKGNDSPARFWGGHAFFPSHVPKDDVWNSFPRVCFFLPQTEIIRREGKIEVITNSINGPLSEKPIHAGYFAKGQMSLKAPDHFPTEKNWLRLIEQSLGEIQTSVFEKVVMARRSTHFFETATDPFEILSRLPSKRTIRFAFQFGKDAAFIGATPERLFKREGNQLYTEAVAGTRKRGQTEEEDLALEKELLRDTKERREFAFVKQSIEEGLKSLCEKLQSQEEDDVIKTPNVQHLHNAFEGKLLEGVHDAAILSALHPTAAMGGLPKSSALEHLLKYEPFERGWYASPLGYSSEKEAEFAVGIRSALVEKDKIHFFAGTGIVAGSLPEKEWEELEHKVSLWRKI